MKILFGLLLLVLIQQELIAQTYLAQPIIQVDVANPTADKPQSKLWYMNGSWWAILPTSKGPTIWQRTNTGWITDDVTNNKLAGVEGRVDTYVIHNKVYAVGVGEYKLDIFCLEHITKANNYSWKVTILHTINLANDESVETATIVIDTQNNIWVSAVAGDKVCIWYGKDDGKKWNKPFVLADDIGKDDICTIVNQKNSVRVIWSDQRSEAVKTRIHKNLKKWNLWETTEIIEQGNKTADDHINTAIAGDGTLYVATKNSLDRIGKPQFVMRILTDDGIWQNFPVCNLEETKQPTRPIVLTVTNHSDIVLFGYTLFDAINAKNSIIAFGTINYKTPSVLSNVKPVIQPDLQQSDRKNQVNNVTGPKNSFPENVPWIVLASDKEGNVYEADLSLYFKVF